MSVQSQCRSHREMHPKKWIWRWMMSLSLSIKKYLSIKHSQNFREPTLKSWQIWSPNKILALNFLNSAKVTSSSLLLTYHRSISLTRSLKTISCMNYLTIRSASLLTENYLNGLFAKLVLQNSAQVMIMVLKFEWMSQWISQWISQHRQKKSSRALRCKVR